MVGAILSVLLTDSVYGWITLHGSYHPGELLDGGWMLYYLLWGAAALHPSMATISQAAAPRMKLTSVRLAGIAIAALIAPAIMVVKALTGGNSDDLVVGGTAVVLFTLVHRANDGSRARPDGCGGRERTMRRAGGALVAATTHAEIVTAAAGCGRCAGGRRSPATRA